MNPLFTRTRWRLVGWTVVVLGAMLLVLGVILYASLTRSLLDAVDGSLETSTRTALAELAEGGVAELAHAGYQGGPFFLLVDAAGQVRANPQAVDVASAPAELLQQLPLGFSTVELGGDRVRLDVRQVPQPGGQTATLIVGHSLADEREAERRLLLILLLGGGVGLLLSLVVAAFVADRALVPIRQAFARQQEFVADASHELRTPLTILHAATDQLEAHCDEPLRANRALLDEVRHEVAHMERLTRDLLELARTDRGELQLALGRVDLAALANDLQERVAVLAATRGIALAVRLDRQEPVIVEADPERIHQIGLILLDNALGHTPPGGEVRLTVGLDGRSGLLGIEDTGEGIPSEHLARIFDRFYRADRARGRATGGAGLGLAIAHALVTAHGGRIALANRPTGGTRASVWLPLASEPTDLPEQALTQA